MGKAILLLVAATAIGTSVLLLQGSSHRLQADERQVDRQEEALAREIARSAYNLIISRARQLEVANPTWNPAQLVSAVNGTAGKLAGELRGGSYETWLYPIGASSYGAVAIGRYGKATHQIGTHRVLQNVLEVPQNQPSRVKVTFLESVAGYCSAIYLQRYVPRNNNGMGNNPGRCDPSNPAHGGSCEMQEDIELRGNDRYVALEPEMIFPPGKNRDNASAINTITLNPGERANFILAVDKDCSLRGRQDVPAKVRQGRTVYFDYLRDALVKSTDDFSQMQEGPYVMIQAHPTKPNTWRLAFEDLDFDREFMGMDKLADVKRYGYGDMKWKIRSGASWGERNGKYSYGGSGWFRLDQWGYYETRDYYMVDGKIVPDFDDQVIEVEFLPAPPA